MLITHKINTILVFILMAFLGASAYFYNLSWWWLLVPSVLWFIIAAIGSGLVWTGYHIKTYCKNPSEKARIVAITFDDGPTPETLKVLALLRQYNAKATFFCIGKQIEKHPEIFKQVLAEGHTVGNHTYTHLPTNGFAQKTQWLQELKLTDELILKNSGKKAKFFRPPYGVTTPYLSQALKITGHKVIGWNIRSLDAVIKDETKIFNRIKTRLKPGSIILLHDTSQKSVNVLEQLLVLLQQNNYEAVTVDRLLNIPAYEE
jgi:peptidoglycan/xylan/chitin deacetylase (PgdA/CDA1 family)